MSAGIEILDILHVVANRGDLGDILAAHDETESHRTESNVVSSDVVLTFTGFRIVTTADSKEKFERAKAPTSR